MWSVPLGKSRAPRVQSTTSATNPKFRISPRGNPRHIRGVPLVLQRGVHSKKNLTRPPSTKGRPRIWGRLIGGKSPFRVYAEYFFKYDKKIFTLLVIIVFIYIQYFLHIPSLYRIYRRPTSYVTDKYPMRLQVHYNTILFKIAPILL